MLFVENLRLAQFFNVDPADGAVVDFVAEPSAGMKAQRVAQTCAENHGKHQAPGAHCAGCSDGA